MARKAKPYIYVWAIECPKCHARKDERCHDMRSPTGRLYGRRTHRERARKIKEEGMTTYVNTTSFPWMSTAATTTGTITWPWTTAASYTMTATITTYTTVPYDTVWQEWNRMHVPVMHNAQQEEINRIRAEAERDRLQAAREQRSRRLLAERVRLEGAQDRALELLNTLVSPDERPLDELIQVRGSDGGLYRIEMHTSTVHGNVVEVDEHGCILARICVAPKMYDMDVGLALPLADGWIGQYLAIKYNEAEFRARGNWSFRRECQNPDVPILERAA